MGWEWLAAGEQGEVEAVTVHLLPTVIAVVVYLFLAAGIFCLVEPSWDYFTSFYFTFFSLTTVGYGDVVPSSPTVRTTPSPLVALGLGRLTSDV